MGENANMAESKYAFMHINVLYMQALKKNTLLNWTGLHELVLMKG